MLRSVRIKNFRGFRDLQVEPLERINLIAGKNNTGKTALLEAILLHLGPTAPELGARLNQWRGIQQAGGETSENWAALFHNFDIHSVIAISSRDDKEQTYELTISLPEAGTTHFTPQASETHALGEKPLESVLSTKNAQRDLLLSFRNGAGHTSRTLVQTISDGITQSLKIERERLVETPLGIFIATRLRSPYEDAQRYSKLVEIGQDESVLAALRLIEPRLRGLRVLLKNGMPLLYGDIGIGRLLPLPYMGEGIARLLVLWLAITTTPHGVILVDEIENGFHASTLKKVWQALANVAHQFDAQICATTHSWECIQAAHEAFSETESYNFRLHRLDRAQDGAMRIVNYKQSMLDTALASDLEVR